MNQYWDFCIHSLYSIGILQYKKTCYTSLGLFCAQRLVFASATIPQQIREDNGWEGDQQEGAPISVVWRESFFELNQRNNKAFTRLTCESRLYFIGTFGKVAHFASCKIESSPNILFGSNHNSVRCVGLTGKQRKACYLCENKQVQNEHLRRDFVDVKFECTTNNVEVIQRESGIVNIDVHCGPVRILTRQTKAKWATFTLPFTSVVNVVMNENVFGLNQIFVQNLLFNQQASRWQWLFGVGKRNKSGQTDQTKKNQGWRIHFLQKSRVAWNERIDVPLTVLMTTPQNVQTLFQCVYVETWRGKCIHACITLKMYSYRTCYKLNVCKIC